MSAELPRVLGTQELWTWLIEHGISRDKIKGQSIRVLLSISNHKKQEKRGD
jgi:hypothetical protein